MLYYLTAVLMFRNDVLFSRTTVLKPRAKYSLRLGFGDRNVKKHEM
jgi:hypothetical protein